MQGTVYMKFGKSLYGVTTIMANIFVSLLVLGGIQYATDVVVVQQTVGVEVIVN